MAKKTESKELVKWDEELAKLAIEATKGISLPAGKFFSLRGGKISLDGAAVGDSVSGIVVGMVYENQYFDEEFDPDAPQSPVCYAFGYEKESMMAPHEESEKPQHEQCKGCPHNEFGSADRGQGKACKNVVRIAIIAEDDLENLDEAGVVFMKIPVMSVRNWERYAKVDLAKTLKRPYYTVVTKITLEADNKSQFRVLFSLEKEINNSKMFSALKTLWEKTMGTIAFPYQVQDRSENKGKKKLPTKKLKFAR